MTSEVWVRRANAGDLGAVLRLVTLMHDEDPPMGDSLSAEYDSIFTAILEMPGRHLMVAGCDGDEVVGTADMVIVPNLSRRGRPWAVVENVVVDPSWRRMGIARALMNHAVAIAEESACYKIELVSAVRRTEAHALYLSLGFNAEVRGFRRYLTAFQAR